MQTTMIKLILTEPEIPVPNTGVFSGSVEGVVSDSVVFVALAVILFLSVVAGIMIHSLCKKKPQYKKILMRCFLFGFVCGVLGSPIVNNSLAKTVPDLVVNEEVTKSAEIDETTFVSGKISAVKSKASPVGYDLYMGANEDYSDLIFVPEDENNETTIASIESVGALNENTYGFTLQKNAKAEDEVWFPLTNVTSIIKTYNETTAANNTTDVYFGVLVDDTVLPDVYELAVDFYTEDKPLTDLTGTKWRFNDELIFDEEFLYNVDFYSKFTVADIAEHNFGVNNITTWTQFAEALPGILESYDATDVSSDLSVQDDNGSLLVMHFGRINYYPMWGDDKLFYSFYDVSDDCMPLSTGTISYTFNDETYRESLIGLITSMADGAAFGEPYTSGFNIFSGQQTITFTGGDDVANSDFIEWLVANATLLERDVDESVTVSDYVGTTWYFRENPNLEPLRTGSGERSNYYVDFYVKMSVADMVYMIANADLGVKTWSELVAMMPEYLVGLGAENVQSSIVITDENDNYVLINYDGAEISNEDEVIWFSIDDERYSHLPSSTGTVSFTYYENDYELTFDEFLYYFGPGASITENYWYGSWAEEFFRIITITGVEGSSSVAANWLKENAYLVHIAD